MGILRDVLCWCNHNSSKILDSRYTHGQGCANSCRRRFLYTCGGIINTIKGTTSTFDGVCHQKFPIAAVKNKQEEKDNDDYEEIIEERDENGKPFYGPSFAKYLDCDNPMDRTPGFRKHLIHFEKFVYGRKWKVESDRAWHIKCSIVDPYENDYNQGYETKATDRELSKFYKLSDIMSPDWF
ncbi:hypothetical protein Tco_0260542 [Tanacetum coccineum]